MNKVYSLKDGEVVSREATPDELAATRRTALKMMDESDALPAMRTCWNCNPAHAHFLEDTADDFLFACVMGCGHYFFNGIDITEGAPDEVTSVSDGEKAPSREG